MISSGLYGTISGSPTSDVVTTGAITIPIMKRLGYRPSFAGAVEVAASTGGSLLPPVMGAAAFIMAEYTGIPYRDIALAAIIPAILFYLPIYLQVHLRAVKTGLQGLRPDEIPNLFTTLSNGWLFIVPLIAISWSLLDGYTPAYSAVYGLMAVFTVSMLKSATRLGPKAIFETLAVAATRMIPVVGACAAATPPPHARDTPRQPRGSSRSERACPRAGPRTLPRPTYRVLPAARVPRRDLARHLVKP